MQQAKLIEKLEKEGYKVDYGKYEYWENIPYVKHDDGSITWLAETFISMGSLSVRTDLSYNKVKEAIELKAYDCSYGTIQGIKNEIEYQKILEEMQK